MMIPPPAPAHLAALLAPALDWLGRAVNRTGVSNGVYQSRPLTFALLTTTLMPFVEKYAKERLRKINDEVDREVVTPLLEEIQRLSNINDMLIRESDAIVRSRPGEEPLVAEYYTAVSEEN